MFVEHGLAVHAEEMEIRWPRDISRNQVLGGTWQGVTYNLSVIPGKLKVRAWNGPPRLAGYVSYGNSLQGGMWCSSQSGGLGLRGTQLITDFETGSSRSPLSVVPGPNPRCLLIAFAHRAREADPLRDVALADYFEHVTLPAKDINGREILGGEERSRRRSHISPGAPPFLHMVGRLGLSSLFLLAAAVLLAQLFARRGLGLAATLLGCVLFAAVLDRSALAAHSARMGNAQLPTAQRVLAAASLQGTFFYAKTARERAEAQAETEDSPPLLREAARRVAGELKH